MDLDTCTLLSRSIFFNWDFTARMDGCFQGYLAAGSNVRGLDASGVHRHQDAFDVKVLQATNHSEILQQMQLLAERL